ncbi:MAG: folate-binding protein, partial [Methylotenera sp.]|nr:folate-binding protein [Methylotenera sp.]
LDAHNQAIGKIVRLAPAFASGYDVLVECRLENLQEGIFWNDVKLNIKPLPYTLEET